MVTTSPVIWILSAVLCSPLHRVLSGTRLVLSFTGRRSGTRHTTPVYYPRRHGELLIPTDTGTR